MSRAPRLPAESTLGQAIRQLRTARGMTLRELAARVDVTPPFMSDLEHDRRRTNRLPQIARALGVDVALLQARDGRLPADLKAWIKGNPGLVDFLEQVRDSGRSVEELRLLFSKQRR